MIPGHLCSLVYDGVMFKHTDVLEIGLESALHLCNVHIIRVSLDRGACCDVVYAFFAFGTSSINAFVDS